MAAVVSEWRRCRHCACAFDRLGACSDLIADPGWEGSRPLHIAPVDDEKKTGNKFIVYMIERDRSAPALYGGARTVGRLLLLTRGGTVGFCLASVNDHFKVLNWPFAGRFCRRPITVTHCPYRTCPPDGFRFANFQFGLDLLIWSLCLCVCFF